VGPTDDERYPGRENDVTAETKPPEAPPPESQPADERVRKVSGVSRLLARPELGSVVLAVVVYLFFAIIAFDNNFVSWGSFASIMNAAAPLGILAVAVALLMIGGEFDLSIGSIIGFAGMTIMVLVTPGDQGGFGWSLWPAIAVALVLALLIGAFNGFLVVTTKLPSFIVTLGTLFIFRGLTIALTRSFTNRTQLGNLDEAAGYDLAERVFASSITIGGGSFSVSILWWFLLTAVATWILLRMVWGNWIFGSGGDANAARNVGVPVRRTKIALFMGTAFAAWLVAVIQAVQFTGADTLRGTGQEFQAIIAAVVGGNLLTGGYGSAIGAAFGAFIFAMVKQGIRITGVDGDWFQVFVGGVLVAGVIFNNYIRLRAVRK
jgi:simple sugar transport system permease protein